MATLFSNATVLPMTSSAEGPHTFTGSVGVAGDRIALVSPTNRPRRSSRAAHPGLREIDCRGRLVMPGLVNTHCHAGHDVAAQPGR